MNSRRPTIHHAAMAPIVFVVLTSCAGDDSGARGRCPGSSELPDDLLCTGLYASDASGPIADGVRAYRPASEFWSDGAEKSRWLYLPPATTIDASSPEGWVFPVGTKAWKEFRLDGRRIETRVLWKVAPGEWAAAAYRWDGAGERAARMREGEKDVEGSGYEIPGPVECDQCHRGAPDHLLGVEPLSLGLAGASGLTLADLAREGRISPAPSATELALTRAADDGSPEGAAATARATTATLWLHTNCGISCHNRAPQAAAYYSRYYAKLMPSPTGLVAVDEGDAYGTAIDRAAHARGFESFDLVVPGDPQRSLVYLFATTRDDATLRAMPPIATHRVDPAGKAALEEWIIGL